MRELVDCPFCNGTGRLQMRMEPVGKCKRCGNLVYNYNLNSLYVPTFCPQCMEDNNKEIKVG